MNQQFETIQKFSKDGIEAATTSLKVVSKGAQSIAAETADYTKKSFEQGTAALEQLIGAKTLKNAIQIQADYAKAAYEGFVAQTMKVSGLYADLAKEVFKPHERLIANVASRAKPVAAEASTSKMAAA